MNNQPSQLMGIFGTGRSGSSWLGSIIDSHPRVAYRFEPFHRLRQNPIIIQTQQLLESPQLTEADLAKVYQILLPANPSLERPPFFPKKHALTLGKVWLRPLTLKYRLLSSLFQNLYTPRQSPPLVFKEVTMEPMMANILENTSMPIVYLVRHPCGVVASTVTGQEQGVMPVGRHTVLDKLLQKHDLQLADQYIPRLNKMSWLEKEALLWRMDVEKGVKAVQQHSQALIVIYERLCDDTLAISQQIFQHFGLDFSKQTLQYIEGLQQKTPSRLREVGIKSYFSVFRNPALTKDKWKQEMSLENQQRVFQLIQDSAAFQECATLGRWD
jgi:hypothetical protein